MDATVSASVEASFSERIHREEGHLGYQVSRKMEQFTASTGCDLYRRVSPKRRRYCVVFAETSTQEESLFRIQRELNIAKTYWKYRNQSNGSLSTGKTKGERSRPPVILQPLLGGSSAVININKLYFT